MVCAAVLVSRTSDWNCELTPAACATAGMISASGGGPLFAVGEMGCTRLTETVVVDDGGLSSAVMPPCAAPTAPKCTSTAPVFVPTGSPFASAVTLSAIPPGGTTPDDGLTVSQGTLVVAVNGVPASAAITPRALAVVALPPMRIT